MLERFAPPYTRQQRLGSPPPDARKASVLVLLYPRAGARYLPLLLRKHQLKHHQGQVALPGGAWEPGESLQATALRELHEELGVTPDQVEILGSLTPFFIPASRFLLHPWVGWTAGQPSFEPDPHEVEEVLESPLKSILNFSSLTVARLTKDGEEVEVPAFAVGPHMVWGATCIVLGELATICEGLSP